MCLGVQVAALPGQGAKQQLAPAPVVSLSYFSALSEATGVENAGEMLVKAQLAASIQKILHSSKLTQTQAAEIPGLPQPKLSRLLHGHFRGVSEAKMMDCITRLGRDLRIVIGAEHRAGQLRRVAAERQKDGEASPK